MMKYFERFQKNDGKIDQEAIGWALNEKHKMLAKYMQRDPKWVLGKKEIDEAIQSRIHGNESWNIMEQVKHGKDILTIIKWQSNNNIKRTKIYQQCIFCTDVSGKIEHMIKCQ